MAKSKKQKDAYIKSKQKPVVQNKTYELQIGKTVDCLKNAVAQLQYPLVINLVPTKRTVNKEQIAFGNLIRNGEKETVIDTFYQGIIGLDLTKNERIILNVLATLISNSNFQTDINKNDVDLRTTTFKFSAKLIRDLSGINDIDPIIKGLSRPFVFKTNNKGGHYVIDRLLRPVKKNSEDKTPKKRKRDCYTLRFSKYLAYDYQNKSVKGYAKRRGFYNKKRHSKYETLFLELLFTKTAKFKDKQAPTEFSMKIKTLLQSINLYDMVHEHRKRVIDYLKYFFKAAFEFGVFIGKPPVFEAKTLNRDDLSKITLTINPDFDWTKCDWDEWNTKKI